MAAEVLFQDILEWRRTELQAPTATLLKSLGCCTSSRKSCSHTMTGIDNLYLQCFTSVLQTAIILHSRHKSYPYFNFLLLQPQFKLAVLETNPKIFKKG